MSIVRIQILDDNEEVRDKLQEEFSHTLVNHEGFKLHGFSKLKDGCTELTYVDKDTAVFLQERLYDSCRNSLAGVFKDEQPKTPEDEAYEQLVAKLEGRL